LPNNVIRTSKNYKHSLYKRSDQLKFKTFIQKNYPQKISVRSSSHMSNTNKRNSVNPLTLFWPRHFRWQVTMLNVIMLSIMFSLFAWHSSNQKKKYITNSINLSGVALAQKISDETQTLFKKNDFAKLDSLLIQYAKFPDIVDLSLETVKGTPLGRVAVIEGKTVIRQGDALAEAQPLVVTSNKTVISEPIVVDTRTIGFVKLSVNLEPAFMESSRLFFHSLLYGVGMSLLFLIITFFYFRKPLKALNEATEFAAKLDKQFGDKFKTSKFANEFEQLGESLNSVSQKLLEQQVQVEAGNVEAKKLAMVASKTNTSIIITDKNRQIEWANESFEKMTGYLLNEILGKKTSELFYGEDTDPKVISYIDEELAQGRGCEVEKINYRKDGKKFWANTAIQPIFDDEGEFCYYIVIESDVTQRKESEAELYEAKVIAEKANLAKSEFLSRMSHELRTPLNAILGFAQILQLDELNEEQEDSVARILKAGKHLLGLINEVLEISRIESGGFALSIETVAIQESVEDVLRMAQPLAADFGINLVCDESLATNYIVLGDLQRINQVLLNLVSNAIKYNRRDGSVTIRCQEQDNDRLRILVQDTGNGIKEEDMERLFTPFDRLGAEQTTIEGSGIGLALTKQLLSIMDGTIGVSSVVGEGTTFWFELPISEVVDTSETVANLNMTPIQMTASLPTSEYPTVVYIEDNLSNVALVERVIDRIGSIDLQVALQGQEGLELVERQHPDLVLLDLHLPLLGGEVILDQLKANEEMKTIPVIVVSADATPKQINKLLDKGADYYLTKPFDVQELADQVQKYLGAA